MVWKNVTHDMRGTVVFSNFEGDIRPGSVFTLAATKISQTSIDSAHMGERA
jgi:hypothetical protein